MPQKKSKKKELITSPKGMRDIINDEYYAYQGFSEKASEIALYYGFKPIETPILERESVFTSAVGEGTDIVESDKRRWVDAHWFRGNSYLKIGWKWVLRALVKGFELVTRFRLSPAPDPDPAKASKKQKKKQKLSIYTVVYQPYETLPV